MPLSEAQIQSRIDALRKAHDTGALIVLHRDTSAQCRSLKEIEIPFWPIWNSSLRPCKTPHGRLSVISGQDSKGL